MNYEEAHAAISNIPNEEDSPIRMWPVDQDDISQAEDRLGKLFPQVLKEVWSDIGAGFFQGSATGGVRISRINALMSPDEVVDACEDYDGIGEGTPFFDISDGGHLILTAEGGIQHPAFPRTEISSSLQAFIAAVTDTPDFWIQKLPSPRP